MVMSRCLRRFAILSRVPPFFSSWMAGVTVAESSSNWEKQCPCTDSFKLGNTPKSGGLISGLYRTWGNTLPTCDFSVNQLQPSPVVSDPSPVIMWNEWSISKESQINLSAFYYIIFACMWTVVSPYSCVLQWHFNSLIYEGPRGRTW